MISGKSIFGSDIIATNDLYGILEDMPMPVMLIDNDKTIRYANTQANNLGMFVDLSGKKCTETFCKAEECTCPLNGADGFYNSKHDFFRKDGTSISVMKTSHPVKLKNARFHILFIIDLSSQEKKEQELQEIIQQKANAESNALNESKKFELLFEEINDALFLHDKKGNIIKVNMMTCDRLGYSKEEFEHMNISDLNTKEFIPKIAGRIDEIVKKGRLLFESKQVAKDGRLIPVQIASKIIEYEGEEVILSSTRDITVSKTYENLLIEARRLAEENENEMKAIFNHAPSTMILFDDKEQILRINEKGLSDFNIDKDSFYHNRLGNVIRCINTENDRYRCGSTSKCKNCELSKTIQETIKNDQEYNKKEITLFLGNGNSFVKKTILISTAVIMKNGKNNYLATIDDITERKQMELELVNAKEKAEESERLKSAFLANISHEIRTPLNGILGVATLFEEDNITPASKKSYIEIINKSSDRLIGTINDILEISKLDSGLSKISSDKFFLRETIDSFINRLNGSYSNPNIRFIKNLPDDLDNFMVETDKSKFTQILKNLLDNAFKFTQNGFVKLSARRDNRNLLVSVEDTGIGIATGDHEDIFRAFRQADYSLNKSFEGSGLGLTISKKLVNLLGGEIWLDSEPERGSVFTFSLTGVIVEKEINGHSRKDLNKVWKNSYKGKTILVAEDEPTNYRYLEIVLSRIGCNLIHAVNGQQAIDLFQQADQVDLVIMDLKMPVMDGFDATLKIREMDKNIPIIAYSAYVMNNEKQRAIENGCNDFLPKPANRNQILEVINQHIN